MSHYIEDPYIEQEYDDIFNDWYEIDGVRKIKESFTPTPNFF